MASTAYQLACPHCSARLRIRDKSFAGRTVNCPDCRRSLNIVAGADGNLIGVRTAQTPPTGSATAPDTAFAGPLPGAPRSSPVTWIAWGVAVAGFAAVLLFVVRRGDDARLTPDIPAIVAQPAEPPPIQPPEPQPATAPPAAGDPTPVVTSPPEPPPTDAKPTSAVEPPPDDPVTPDGPHAAPLDVPLAPDEPAFDIHAALAQPLVAFHQPIPRAASELLKLVGELAGVAVDTTQLSAAAAQRLKQPVTLSLNDTTVRGVLDAITQAAGLSYSLRKGSVVLTEGQAHDVNGGPGTSN